MVILLFEYLKRASVSLLFGSANKGITGSICLMSLVWRCLYQGLNPGPLALVFVM